MKRVAHIINRVSWVVVAILLTIVVCLKWLDMNCPWQSLMAAAVFYGSCIAGLASFVDKTIDEWTTYWE